MRKLLQIVSRIKFTKEKAGMASGGILGGAIGVKTGVAALGTAVNGIWVFPIVGIISGYALVKWLKSRKLEHQRDETIDETAKVLDQKS